MAIKKIIGLFVLVTAVMVQAVAQKAVAAIDENYQCGDYQVKAIQAHEDVELRKFAIEWVKANQLNQDSRAVLQKMAEKYQMADVNSLANEINAQKIDFGSDRFTILRALSNGLYSANRLDGFKKCAAAFPKTVK